MDEELINATIEDTLGVDMEEVVIDVSAEDHQQHVVDIDMVSASVKSEEIEEVEIEIEESIGWVGGDSTMHYSLAGRDRNDQHPITAITGLREKLEEIERIKTVYSDKAGLSNYYKWNGDAHDYGYFVSLVPNTTNIDICSGKDIFGVVVLSSGFIGGRDSAASGNAYALVATSGIVSVRCELDVDVGDYVISNSKGYAKKSGTDYGYKVFAKETKSGIEYAIIMLDVQADVTYDLGKNLELVRSQADANYKNIISVSNLASQAYAKADEVEASNREMSGIVSGALTEVDNIASNVSEISEQVVQATLISAQAKAIADSAATHAVSIKTEAVDVANKSWVEATALREDFKLMDQQITDIEHQVTIVVQETGENGTAIAGIRTEVNGHESVINQLASWQGETNASMARLEQKADENGAYIQSTVTDLDKYTVGPHSQADGLTLEQAASILESETFYVPIEQTVETYELTNEATEWPEGDKEISRVYYKIGDDNTKTYVYWGNNGSEYTWVESDIIPKYTRTFMPHYLYQWGRINATGPYGWITVDKFYKPIQYDETVVVNTSSQSVYFQTHDAPAIAQGSNFGYWYTNGDNLTGTAADYNPHTLYKWKSYTTKDDAGKDAVTGRWMPVATLAGNVNNRAISQIRQAANEMSLDISNARGSITSLSEKIDDTSSEVQGLALWSKGGVEGGEQYNLATIKQTAENAGADIALVVQEKDGKKVVNGASIAAAINSQTGDSFVSIEGKYVNLKGQVTFESFDTETKKKIEADSIDVQIWSSRGNIFKSGDTSTILTCVVFSGGVDITSTLPNSAFTWTKTNNDGSIDENWTATPYGNNANKIQISPSDIFSRAMFNCTVQIEYE